ncbi:MAG: hypothetical protein KGS45_12005 [Planctomycetes bacterium]|nr:hypothetical protein [Planctomycetota bacterium]
MFDDLTNSPDSHRGTATNTPDALTASTPSSPSQQSPTADSATGNAGDNGIDSQRQSAAKHSTQQPATQETFTQQPVPNPGSFNFTTNQAIMTIATVVGVLLIVHSLRRMNSKKSEPVKPKLGGNMDELLALRNEIYAKYPPPAKAPRPAVRSSGSETGEPSLRLVDDRRPAESAGEIATLRRQVEQLTQELAHLQGRVRDLEAGPLLTPAALQGSPFSSTRATSTSDATTSRPADHDNVYRLADRGMSAVEIAKTLGKHTGQVELILNLRRATGS